MKVTNITRQVGLPSVAILKSLRMDTIVLTCLIFVVLQLQYEPNNALTQSVNDPNLEAESFVEGLNSPTSMAFLDSKNILVLEKEG